VCVTEGISVDEERAKCDDRRRERHPRQQRLRQDRLVLPSRRAVHDGGIWRVHTQRQDVDEQYLHRVQRRRLATERADRDERELGRRRREPEREEAPDVVEDRFALLDGGDERAEFVVDEDDVRSLLRDVRPSDDECARAWGHE
jgi:hypothetical protein